MCMAWCSKCQTDVSLAHAVAELPCPSCGSNSYFLIVDDGERETLLGEAERMMRIGRWLDASAALSECRNRGLISDADFNLSSANLEWRKQCAAAAVDLVAMEGMPLPDFRAALESEFDSFVVDWLLRDCRMFRLVPDGGGYIVEVS